MKMAFFLHDLHRTIERKYSETSTSTQTIVYRGQALSNTDFEKLKKNQGGLLSFNNFLSTSLNRDISKMFAESVLKNSNTTGVLFKVEIDLLVSGTPYAFVDQNAHFLEEEEVLFSMHAVFRIIEMHETEDHIWEVRLLFISDNDPQLKEHTDRFRTEVGTDGRI